MPETTESPAAVLRRAADKLRQLATAAEHDVETNTYWRSELTARPDWYANGVRNGLGGPSGELAAAMHPGVGAALADWLEYEARLTDRFVGMGGTDHFDSLFTERPLAVALAVLGEEAPAASTDVDAQQVSR